MNPMKQNAREAYETPVVTDIAPVTVTIGQSDSLVPTSPEDGGDGGGGGGGGGDGWGNDF